MSILKNQKFFKAVSGSCGNYIGEGLIFKPEDLFADTLKVVVIQGFLFVCRDWFQGFGDGVAY